MEHMMHMLLYRAFHAQRSYLHPCLRKIGLGPGQPKLLSYLALHGPCRQRELADYFEIDPAAVSRMLDSLQKGGFINRSSDLSCRRSDLITLTELGEQANQSWQQYCRQMEQTMLRDFSPEEAQQLAQALGRVYRNLQQQKEEESVCKT